MERLFFAKVELWVVLLVILLGMAVTVLYGGMVRHVLLGGNSAGAIGEVALATAEFPANVKKLIAGDFIAEEPVSESTAAAFSRSQYRPLIEDEDPIIENMPIAWSVDAPLQPIYFMMYVNESYDEKLFIADENRQIVNSFPIRANSLSGKYEAIIGMSDVVMLEDGTVLVHPQGGDGAYRQDLCGRVIWSIPGLFHHHYSVADGKLYLLGLPSTEISDEDREDWNTSDIVNVIDVATGRIERSVSIGEIAAANAGRVDPLFWERWRDSVKPNGVLPGSFVHLNKVEVLSAAMADQYPDFQAGVWMLSSRHLNLIFIVDPATLEILWYSHGYTQVQHDPKFVGDNKIMVFNNSFSGNRKDPKDSANFTSIKQYDFSSEKWTELYNSQPVNGYTFHSGNFDIGSEQSLLINLSLQGRYLEVSRAGEILSEFINVRGDKRVYWTKSAHYLSDQQFDLVKDLSCAN